MTAAAPALAPERASLGIALICASFVGFSMSDAMAKWLGQSFSPVEIVFFRHLIGLLPAAAIVWRAGGRPCTRCEPACCSSLFCRSSGA